MDPVVPGVGASCQHYDAGVGLLLRPLEGFGQTLQLVGAGSSVVEGEVQDANVAELLVANVPACV